MRYQKSEAQSVHLAIIVSRKVGKAVFRNKIKRRLREIFRTRVKSIADPGYYLFIAKGSIVQAKFEDLEKDILALVQRILMPHK